ncbi:MAG: site-2 protease family protein [Nanoarchaeota archaeon]|nr:site-2 protease family protein [Nanoarchaeota archaeon]
MVSFWVYDVGFLILFSAFVAWFLSSRKKDLSREGLIFMYRTQFGVKVIKYIGDNFKRTLHSIKYLIIGIGFVLMGAMLWMLGQTVAIYLLHPEITKIIKAPPIAPLIPYFPKLFGMESFFPPFYFTYFIVALAIVAIVHEFSHGIFMRLFKIKIKSTGLVFLGPILGAFVEEEKSGFEKKKKIEQMTVLGAGVFANLVFALIFYLLYMTFFFTSFAASGYIFNSYGAYEVPLSSIGAMGQDMGPMAVLLNGKAAEINLTEVQIAGSYYFMSTQTKEFILRGVEIDNYTTVLFEKAPAILAQMHGAIIQADDVKITGQDKLREFLENKHPGEAVKFITEDNEGIKEYNIILGERPDDSTKAYLGVGHSTTQRSGFIQNILGKFMSFKESSTLYKPTWDGELVYFINYLLWWVMVINLLVALFNMLPIGILDGGRFFYLTMLGIFKSEKIAKRIYNSIGYAILFMFVLMMFFWFIRII